MPKLLLNGRQVNFSADSTVAATILRTGVTCFRSSETGEPRAPLCGMGICYECRVTIDGHPHARSCQIACREGMVIATT